MSHTGPIPPSKEGAKEAIWTSTKIINEHSFQIKNMNIRQANWNIIENKGFDIAIIGGGINGSSNYQKLCREGYKVFLVDKGDFSCGTSQSSAMMIWGGLLYLKNLDFSSVCNFSRDRDILIDSFRDHVISKYFRYIPNSEWGRNKYLVYLAMQIYWMLGKCKRERPTFQTNFEETDIIKHKNAIESITYQEGFLRQSDSRFVLDWIFNNQTEKSLALNYTSIQNAHYNKKDKLWFLELRDNFSGKESTIKAKIILNCAGVWTDKVNNKFGIKSPYKHVCSKGVFIGFERPEEHLLPLIFEMGEHGDTLTFIPWGPISLWGPTETMEKSIECGFSITPDDIHFLLKHASRNLKPFFSKSKIISFRCGLRPLAVKTTFNADCYPLDISRNCKIIEDCDMPWISIYGGKISGCISMAEKVAKRISDKIHPDPKDLSSPEHQSKKISWASFPGLHEKVPTIDWCVSNEFCCTLEDYLRRRTNISQWVPREGLGFQDNNFEYLRELSLRLPTQEGKKQESCLLEYRDAVHSRFDALLKQI
jgi:glycerol-3-phosphate dehydrogenase